MALAFQTSGETSTAPSAAPTQGALFAKAAEWAPVGFSIALLGLGAFAPGALNDGDTFWHIEAGRWILAHGAAPHVDPFSYTYAGTPWTAHEWLAEVFVALAYGAAGLKGVTALTGAAVGGAFYAVARKVRGDLSGPAVLGVLGLAALILAPSLLARPHILALPAVALWSLALERAGEKGQSPPWLVLPLMTLWANMHGGFVFGLALIAPFGLDALLNAAHERRIRLAARWALFAALAVGAATLTPYGVEGLLFPLKLATNPNMAVVDEWQPEKLLAFGPFEWALLGLFAVGLTRGLKLRFAPAALLLLLVFMTLQHSRHALLFAVLAPALLAAPLARAFSSPSPRVTSPSPLAGEGRGGGSHGPFRFLGLTGIGKSSATPLPCPPPQGGRELSSPTHMQDLIFLGLALALLAARLIVPLPLHDTKPTPVSALAAVPQDIRPLPVFNGLADGGYLILNGVKPFIDGRFDMYPKAHVDAYLAASRGDAEAAKAVFDRYQIAWTLLPPSSKLVALLDADAGWRRLYADAFAVVHVRADATLRGSE